MRSALAMWPLADLRVIRPAPTAAQPPEPFPRFAGYGLCIASLASRRSGSGRLYISTTTTIGTFNTRCAEGSSAPRSWTEGAFHGLRRASTATAPSFPSPKAGFLAALAHPSLTSQTAPIAPPASHPSLSITHQGIATRAPASPRVLQPHRQAIVNLSLPTSSSSFSS